MRVFKTRDFAKAKGPADDELMKAMDEVEQGLIDAHLGGSVVKKRVKSGSKGKRGGFRTVLAYRASNEKIFCVYVFPKNERDNITNEELTALKRLAKELFSWDEQKIEAALKSKELIEVSRDGDQEGETRSEESLETQRAKVKTPKRSTRR